MLLLCSDHSCRHIMLFPLQSLDITQHQSPCRISTAALEVKGADAEDFKRAQTMLRRCGGHRFTCATIPLLVDVDRSKLLALCPCTLTKQKVAQLQSRQDFAIGKAFCWQTGPTKSGIKFTVLAVPC